MQNNEFNIRNEMPTLQVAAEKAAQYYQRKYIHWKKAEYSLLIIAAGSVVAVPALSDDLIKPAYILSALAFGASLLALWIEHALWYRRAWYNARIMAEEILSEFWKFLAATNSYRISSDDQLASQSLNRFIVAIRQRLSIDQYLAEHIQGNQVVSKNAFDVRQKPLDQRRHIYLNSRVFDQITWYNSKTATAHRNRNRIHLLLFFFLLIGCILGFIQAFGQLQLFSTVALISTIVASIAGWHQVRGYDVQIMAYSTAARDLSGIASSIQHANAEQEFEHLVQEAENRISREHSTWVGGQ